VVFRKFGGVRGEKIEKRKKRERKGRKTGNAPGSLAERVEAQL